MNNEEAASRTITADGGDEPVAEVDDPRASYFQRCRIPPISRPSTAPTTRVAAYVAVPIASGKLKRSPKARLVSHGNVASI